MNDNQQQNGFFSDDYVPQKRENPYLKRNRSKDRPQDTPAGENAPSSKLPKAPEAKKTRSARKRSFSDWMFEHVKVIATIATILVVLSLVLITDVVTLAQNAINHVQQADREEITLTYVRGLAEMGQPITWRNLERFRRDETKAKDSVTWMLPVKGTDYELWISGYSTDKAPTYVYLFDMRTGDRLALGEEDLDRFIEEHSK